MAIPKRRLPPREPCPALAVQISHKRRAACVRITAEKVEGTQALGRGLLVDYDRAGRIVGFGLWTDVTQRGFTRALRKIRRKFGRQVASLDSLSILRRA